MISIMLIDDDPLITEGLRRMLAQMEASFGAITLCESGEQALSTLERRSHDLVITDLKMPGIDGLELIRRAKANHPDTKFIILSGYHEFVDAVDAIRYGVIQYLTKPVSSEELYDAVIAAQRTIRMERQYRKNARQNEALREELIQSQLDLIVSQEKWARFDLQRATELDSRLARYKGGLCVCVCAPKQMDSSEARDDVAAALARYADDDCNECLFFSSSMGDLVAFLPGEKQAQRLFEAVAVAVRHVLVMGLGGHCQDIAEAWKVYERAKHLTKYRIVILESRLMRLDNGPQEALAEASIEKIKALFSRLSSDKGKDIGDAARGVLRLDEIRAADIRVCEQLADIINYSILHHCSEHIPHHLAHIVRKYEALRSPYGFDDVQDYLDTFAACLEEMAGLFPAPISVENEHDAQKIRTVLEYVHQNYHRNINLQSVAEKFSYNYSYFSWLFSKATGMRFTDYLLTLRINQAKKLLGGYHKSIRSVAEMVGYVNTKSFTKAFKQRTGLTPQEYSRKVREDGTDNPEPE